MKRIGVLVAAVAIALAAVALIPRGPREAMPYDDRTRRPRQLVVAREHAAVAGTPWATRAAVEVLERGGNACDAAVAALLVVNVTHAEAASFPGVAPAVVYDAASGRVRSYVGAGTAPAAATLERFRRRGWTSVPFFHLWAQLVPASPDVVVVLLRDCGSRSFAELAEPAIEIAREGFPAHAVMVSNLDLPLWRRMLFAWKMPYNAKVFMDGEWWRRLHLHERMRFGDLADTLAAMAAAERAALAAGGGRREGLQAVRDHFYRGPIARAIDAFHRREGGLMTAGDLAAYAGGWEQPVTGAWGDYRIHSNGAWSQGMVAPLALGILDGVDLAPLGHNSPRYVHAVAQALELAIADRDAWVGDPRFVDVPMAELTGAAYAERRRRAMTGRAFGALPAPGRPAGVPAAGTPARTAGGAGRTAPGRTAPGRTALAGWLGQDTSQVAVVDSAGNAVVLTPSDFPATPMVPGTGLTLGNRMTQFRLDPEHPGSLEPGKRPRITPHAIVVTREGRLHLATSTPGGDMQPQALVQVFLNLHVFGMDLQAAIDAPRFYSISAPSSFAPHEAHPATLRLEVDLYARAATGLRGLGYTVHEDPAWDKDFGAVGAILVAPDGRLHAGADPREETTAGGR